MPVLDLFKALQASPVGSTISTSTWMFPTIETVHVIALSAVLGSIVVVDLRLLGVASKERPVTALTHEFLPWTWGAFAVAAVSGLLLFSSRAADYVALPAFNIKFVFMGLAALNMLAFHFTTYRSVGAWDTGRPAPAARIAGGVSLLLWAALVICGRKVGFSL
jgi:hypothetical protein